MLGTSVGASALAMASPHSPQTLREQVTSKGGTTHEALSVMQAGHWAGIVVEAVQAAHRRAGELGDEFGAG